MYRFEEARQKHIAQYGGMLFCPDRDTDCFFKEEEWKTGRPCCRKPCILDDPEDIELKKRIEKNRKKREPAEAQRREEEQNDLPARRRRRTKNWRDIRREKIRRLEKESEQAYRRNRPKIGENKLYEAMRLRRELRREENIDV